MIIRGLMVVNTITRNSYNDSVTIGMAAQYDSSIPEERRFSRATPNATLTMTVDGTVAAEQFSLGRKFYLDFQPVDAAD